MKATLNDHVIAESNDIVQNGGYAYFPADATRREWLEKAPKTGSDRACPHGVQFYDAVIDGQRYERSAWVYESPRPSMAEVAGRFGFWHDVKVA
nr:DUF427 domain-containing protein [uncultured Rhodopila sp.]